MHFYIKRIIALFILLVLYFIIKLPLGLHISSGKYDKVDKIQTYIYRNYIGIPVITKVFDSIGFQKDATGDYSYESPIYLAFGFDNKKASVWLFYTNYDDQHKLYIPACININGDLLHYGYCDNSQDDEGYAQNVFSDKGILTEPNIPLWQQYYKLDN